MNKKKILLSFFAILLLHSYTHGETQSNDSETTDAYLKAQTEDVKKNAEFVFEGYIIRRDVYPRKDKNGETYYPTCCIVKITKVFRGDLKKGTVEIAGVQSTDRIIPSQKRVSYIPDSTKYFFFCRAAGKDHPYDATYDIYPVDNKIILKEANSNFENYFRIDGNQIFETKMHSKGEMYRHISRLPHVKMPKLTEQDTVEVYRGEIRPSKRGFLTQVEKDSLRAIRIAKKLQVVHFADSIGRVKTDSVGLVKKK